MPLFHALGNLAMVFQVKDGVVQGLRETIYAWEERRTIYVHVVKIPENLGTKTIGNDDLYEMLFGGIVVVCLKVFLEALAGVPRAKE